MKINGIPLHDLHLHTGLSMCSRDKDACPETYAPIAAKNGVELIGISDHIWDIRIKLPMDIDFTSNCFEHQLQHFNDCARVQHGVKILYSAEVEYFCGMLGIHESSAALLDYVLVAPCHFHAGPRALPEEYKNHEGVAYYLTKTFDEVCENPLTQAVAHPFDPMIFSYGDDLRKIYKLVGWDRFAQSLQKCKDNNISFEINFSLSAARGTPLFDETYLKLFKLAKEIGCKFHFGTDAHSRLVFDELTQPEVYRYYINALDLQPSDMSEIVFQ